MKGRRLFHQFHWREMKLFHNFPIRQPQKYSRCFSVLQTGWSIFSSPIHTPILSSGFSSVESELYFGQFPAVKLTGLPHHLSPVDLANFLNGLQPLDMVVQYAQGVPTQSIAVLFKDFKDVEEALKLHRKYIGSRYVNVIRCRRDEYFHIVYQDVLARRPKYPTKDFKSAVAVIKLEGLSYETLPHDVYRFCQGQSPVRPTLTHSLTPFLLLDVDYIVREDAVLVCSTAQGHPSGRAYVQLEDQEKAEKAIKHLHQKFLGIRKIRVSLSSPEEASAESNLYF
jgi:heterogeneous nuclear ribonucleoprotein F/H